MALLALLALLALVALFALLAFLGLGILLGLFDQSSLRAVSLRVLIM